MDPDDTPDAQLPGAAERLLERWRSLDEPDELELGRFDQVMNILRSSSVRDSHETLVDTALLAAPLPPERSDGLLARVARVAPSDAMLAKPGMRAQPLLLAERGRLAEPLPPRPSSGSSLPEADSGISISLQALALEQLLGRQRIASAVSGLTVALFLALVLWMASSNQVGASPLVRGPQAAPRLQQPGADSARERSRSTTSVPPVASEKPAP